MTRFLLLGLTGRDVISSPLGLTGSEATPSSKCPTGTQDMPFTGTVKHKGHLPKLTQRPCLLQLGLTGTKTTPTSLGLAGTEITPSLGLADIKALPSFFRMLDSK